MELDKEGYAIKQDKILRSEKKNEINNHKIREHKK